MLTHPECLPCFMKQARFAAQRANGSDPALEFRAIQYAAVHALPLAVMTQTPAENATRVFKAATDFLRMPDPYADEKRRYNDRALDVADALRAVITAADDPLATALKVAALGNVLDLNISGGVDVGAMVDQVQSLTWGIDHSARLRQDIASAERILFLGDNAGEIVFDRLLIEVLPPGTVTYVVKSGPIANDVLLADAEQVHMHAVADVIENGSDGFGTPLARCSPAFRAAFDAADVIISKGMANIETLSEVDANLYFILKIKCPVVAMHVGAQHGDLVLLSQRARLA